MRIDEIMVNLIYLGETPDYKNRTSFEYVYYKLKGFEDMYIDIRLDKSKGEYQLYSIGDSLNFLKSSKKKKSKK